MSIGGRAYFAFGLALAGLTAAPVVAEAQTAPAAEKSAALEEVVVTVQRRTESLQTAPLSATALAGDALETRQIADVKSVVFNAPNLTGNSNIGQSSATTFFIRGIGTTENLLTADTSVGLYVDDVYVARQAVNNFALFDVERIEVLRGPQGALYGRNTNGGAIKIVTKKPNQTPELTASAAIGSFNAREARVAGNLPLGEEAALRAGVLLQQADGYIRNTTLNRDVNDKDYLGARAALRVEPTPQVRIDVAADWGRDKSNGGYASDIAGSWRPRTKDLFTVVSPVANYTNAQTWGLSATLDIAINEAWSIESITAYRYTAQDLVLDLSDQNPSLYTLRQNQKADQASQEFKLTGRISERARVVGGVYWFTESGDAAVQDITRASPAAGQTFFTKRFTVDVESIAAFGQFELDAGPLTFIAGGRYTEDERLLDIAQTSTLGGPFSFTTADLRARRALGQKINPTLTFERFTPKLGVNWQVNEDLFAYVSYTQGYRSGGWTGRALRVDQYLEFSPEIVNSYEGGLKATVFDGRARLNTSIFSMDYDNLFNTLTVGGVFTVQTANARIQGLESELTARLAPWLDVFANVGVLDASYQGQRPVNLAADLQRAPELQAKLGFSIDRPVGEGALLASADAFYTSPYLVNPANLAFTAPLVPANLAETGDFTLVNAQIGYRFPEDRARLMLSCTNCFDQDYFDAITVIGRYGAAYAGAPQLWRLALSTRF